MPRVAELASALAVLTMFPLATPAVAQAEPVTIRVIRLPDNKPISATIRRRAGDHVTPVGEVDDTTGALTVPETDCTLATIYIVKPKVLGEYEYEADGKEQPCVFAKSTPFAFYSVRYAEVLAPTRGNIPAAWKNVAGVTEAFASINGFVEKADYGSAAILSIEAAAKLRADGQDEIAKAYEQIGTFYGMASIAKETEADYTDVIAFDKDQSRYVVTPDGADAIKGYQASMGLMVNGTLDWQTMFSSSDLKSDPAALWKDKVEVLNGFGGYRNQGGFDNYGFEKIPR